MTKRKAMPEQIRLPVALACSACLHVGIALIPINVSAVSGAAANLALADRRIHVILVQRLTTTRDQVRPQEVAEFDQRASKPTTTLGGNDDLSRPPELIQGSLDEMIGTDPSVDARGILQLQIHLNSLGKPTSVTVLESTMVRDFEGYVVERFFNATYRAGERNGVPVDSDIVLSIGFTATSSNRERP